MKSMLIEFSDEYFMKLALREAQIAMEKDEVPIGALIVCNNQVIARSHNLTEQLNDVTAHAEMQAFTSAASYLGGKYLKGCTLYVTLEPCLMCAGAAFWTQLDRIVFGASDPKRGYQSFGENSSLLLHPKTKVTSGILQQECSSIVQDFFRGKR